MLRHTRIRTGRSAFIARRLFNGVRPRGRSRRVRRVDEGNFGFGTERRASSEGRPVVVRRRRTFPRTRRTAIMNTFRPQHGPGGHPVRRTRSNNNYYYYHS